MALSKTEKGIERIEGDEYDQGVGDGLISSLMVFRGASCPASF
ncbi:hypothetical protein B4113_0311 [Geobacillus sp. B4113_201601]|nr:hypothetical protein B4113_0311 [Geobacillus sp. B4113_201601]